MYTGLVYEACHRMPETLQTCKKSMPCLIKKALRCAACLKQKCSLSFTFCKNLSHKDLTRKSCVFICYFIGSLVEIVLSEAATGGVLYKKVFLKFAKLTGKYNCQSLF